MASSPILSWQIDGDTMETVRNYFWRLQNHCRWWLQPWNLNTLAPWKKSYDQPRQYIKKQRQLCWQRSIESKLWFFQQSYMDVRVWPYWRLFADRQRIDAFELWCWKRALRVHWTTRRSNQSILKEINPEYSLEGLMLKLKLHYFGSLMVRADSKKDPGSGKDWGQEEKGVTERDLVGWYHPLSGHEFEQTPEES